MGTTFHTRLVSYPTLLKIIKASRTSN